MRFRSNPAQRWLIAFLCLILALSLAPFLTRADVKSKVQIQIGKPSVWSMGQAHYLLAKIHKDNRGLGTRMPTEKELDPNAINTTRIQLLRTLLDVEGQYSHSVGATNQSLQREEQFAVRQREEARAELFAKTEELNGVNADLRKLKRTRARKQADYDQREAERLANATDGKTPLPDQAQNDLKKDIAELNTRIANKEDEKQSLEEEIGIAQEQAGATADAGGGQSNSNSNSNRATTANSPSSLRQRAGASVEAPKFSDVTLGNGGSLPAFNESLKDIITAAMKDSGKPSLAASIALDNFIGMQYEIIAKRLTLLRDEVGPDERVIFLELPSSIYTVPCKGDDYIAQVQWKVNWFYDDKQARASMVDENIEDHTNIEDVLNNKTELGDRLGELEKRHDELGKKRDDLNKKLGKLIAPKDEEKIKSARRELERLKWEEESLSQKIRSVRREIERIGEKVDEEKWKPAFTSNVRALDVIPRQSALNVNDAQATVSQKNFLGVLKLLFGLGIRVSYQRQRELYEQYLQQEVFASGFGKGSNAFGWTFGALPGTNRVAPGVRTTYAVLAVPRQASALRIEATGVAYHRKSAPDYDLDERRYDPNSKQVLDTQQFIVRVPNEHTEQFKVMSVAYSPVKAGERVTVVVKGDYFSPQVGVLVDGVALNRSLSVGNTEISDAGFDNTVTSGVRGQYELVSSHEIVMKFSMGDDKYVGTPNITLITPEKSTAINYLPLQVNYLYPRISLRSLASTEPMFIEPFTLSKTFDGSEEGKFYKARLTGTGLRSKAIISVNGQPIPFFKDRKWKLIKEATDEYIGSRQEQRVKEDLYMLLLEQPEPGMGHVDQMITDKLVETQPNLILNAPEQPFVDQLLKNKAQEKKPLDKEDKRAIFLLFLNQDRAKPNDATDDHYRKALKEVAYALFKDPKYVHLQEVFVHEFLIRQFAENYADRICLKNGVRGTECTEASRHKVMQRRQEELLSDNVDPFNQDEPYHNEELYQELREDLLKDLILTRKKVMKEKYDEVKYSGGVTISDEEARKKLIDVYADEFAREHQNDCKDLTSEAEKKDCNEKLKEKAKDQLSDFEVLYQAIKKEYLKAGRSIKLCDDDRELERGRKFISPPVFDEAKARLGAIKEIENIYEKPGDYEEYAIQESTRAYTVRFLSKGSKTFKVRYSQKTSSGFDSEESSKKGDPDAKVVRYIPNVGSNAALADIRFSVDKEKVPTITLLDSNAGKIESGPFIEDEGKLRVSFYVNYQQRGKDSFAERDHIWVKLTPPQGKPKNMDIELPVVTRITRIANSRTHKPEGYADEQALIRIYGYNLQTVVKVLFAGKEASLIGTPDFNSVLLQAPKGEPVAKGEAVEVPVVLLREDGTQVASPILYTYLGPPSPVVIYRPRRVKQNKQQSGTDQYQDDSYAEPDSEPYAEPETRPRIVRRRKD